MRLGALYGARFALFAGPVALAFFAGGYFDQERAWAGVVAAIVLLVAVTTAARPWPRGTAGRVAIVGLAALGGWTLVSMLWAPLPGTAYHDGQRVMLYLAALVAAVALLRRAERFAEPAIAGGALVVIGYGLSERLLPGLLTFTPSAGALGRLEQPLTYWNATGLMAALGIVLCARMAGDLQRAPWLRGAAAAAAVPLGMGLFLTVSRGSMFAAAAGMLALIVAAPARPALRGAAVTLGAVILGALAAAPFDGITQLTGHHSDRVTQGIVGLVLLILLAGAAAAVQLWLDRRERDGRLPTGTVRMPRRAPMLALAVAVAGFAIFLALGSKESSGQSLTAGVGRLTTTQSNRYAYWHVAYRAFRAEPVRGIGAGGFAVWWRRYRTVDEGAQDAHSLPLETAAELGLVGAAILAVMIVAVGIAARNAHRLSPALAAGPIAGVIVWATHAAIDWDWEMPAVTLPAIVLAGSLIALADPEVES